MGFLQVLLKDKIKELGMSNREAARNIHIAHTTLNRIVEGDVCDLDTLMDIATWLQVKPSSLIDADTFSQDQFVSQIATLLETYPRLAEVFSEVITRVVKEEISPDTFADIAAYAAFRMNIGQAQKILIDDLSKKEIKE